MKQSAKRLTKSLLLPVVVTGLSLFATGQLFGGRGIAVVAVTSFLWVAWRFDNHTGSIFLLAVLLLITLGVIALLAVVFGAVA